MTHRYKPTDPYSGPVAWVKIASDFTYYKFKHFISYHPTHKNTSFILINLQMDLHTHLAIYPFTTTVKSTELLVFLISVLEPNVSVPRKSSEESSLKWAVASGIILCGVIILIVGLCFHHQKKCTKNGANNNSFIESNEKEFCKCIL